MANSYYGHAAMKNSKYGNVKTKVGNITFDSKAEAERYMVLKSWEMNGIISSLRRQVKFVLLPRTDDENGRMLKDDNGKIIGRPICYVADFTYIKDGKTVVEDVKGYRTPVYILKRRLMLDKYGIIVKEIG